ncbi:hypothetical protein BGW38_008703 [Lunasporangiospora selenospora]|uniref:RRM domain-containing protein n=1 Tax=Lunasporangiospora selenospora TaxID=979761 RepID=A0A9P6KGD9_9FUNG|nr:hypothetical protein BGW38_008703 [Lunasporangiospora selenospora]
MGIPSAKRRSGNGSSSSAKFATGADDGKTSFLTVSQSQGSGSEGRQVKYVQALVRGYAGSQTKLKAHLDDIIKKQRQGKKNQKKPNKAGATKTRTIPKKSGGVVKGKAPVKTEKFARSSKPNAPYAKPINVKKEQALFTESYKAAKAPVKEIFTAGYIPKASTNLKLFTTNYKKEVQRKEALKDAVGPLTTKSLRLVTVQQVKKDAAPQPLSVNQRRADPRGERIPTEPRAMRKEAEQRQQPQQPRQPRQQNPPSQQSQHQQQQHPQQQQQQQQQQPQQQSHQQRSSNARGGDFYRPTGNSSGRSDDRGNDRRGSESHSNARGGSGDHGARHGSTNNNTSTNNYNSGHTNHASSITSSNSRRVQSPERNVRQETRVLSQQTNNRAPEKDSSSMDVDMEDTSISIRGSAPGSNVSFKGESGPVTIEIENLDPETTAEDVKYVCSRFGEIKSCICSHGFSQVTYARKAAGLAAIENLHGKKADNGKILRVTMRKNAVIHDTVQRSVPSSIAGPMKILTKAVQGTIANPGTLYSDHIVAAENILKAQQHRMAQLQQEEQRLHNRHY